MRAAVVVQDAGGKRLEVRDVAEPVPGESEVLVRVRRPEPTAPTFQ